MPSRSLVFASVASLVVLTALPAAFADTYQDLQTGTNQYRDVLSNDISEQATDQLDVKAEAKDAFFADVTGSGAASSRKAIEDMGPYVIFRLNGVPYPFKDVPSSEWFAPYVRDVADRGIVSGYLNASGLPTGMFGPGKSVTVAELAKMALESAHADRSVCGGVPPKNVAAQTMWASSYISCAESLNLAIYADGTVDINRPATRAEVVMTILQAFGVQLRDAPPPGVTLKDVSASTLFSSAIFTAMQDGVASGYADLNGNLTGYFGPDKPVNRAEVSKMISIAVQIY